jgi:RNA polymerase sigma factor (sigma-70 family)
MENTTATDIELVNKIKESNCEESLKILIYRHSPLCFDVCKKYASAILNSGLHLEDITSEKDYLIYKSAISYNPEKKTKFSTWLGNQMRYYCLNTMNKNNLIATDDTQLDYFIHKDIDNHPKELVSEQMEYISNLIRQSKDKRIKKVIEIRYFENPNKKTPWNKVADKVGVSTQTAINLHNKAVKMIRGKMRSTAPFISDKI